MPPGILSGKLPHVVDRTNRDRVNIVMKLSSATGIFEFAVAWRDSNYVATLSADVLSTENLEPLGHIFGFATLPLRLQGR